MLTIAYLTNEFPAAVEPYVSEEILELRRRGIRVIAGSVRKVKAIQADASTCLPEIALQPLRMGLILRAVWICLARCRRLLPLWGRVLFRGKETTIQRMKALLHTGLGAYYAVLLKDRRIDHIHVHHGYFGSWIGMVAAELLGAGFSVTIHGSDLLLHARYLDVKLGACNFCVTVSEYNRRHILEHLPEIDSEKIVVSRLGVSVDNSFKTPASHSSAAQNSELHLLAVGRLHAVKDHAFLVRACAELNMRGVDVRCVIAGDGPERRQLELLIRNLGIEEKVALLGHIPHHLMDSLYGQANIVVLTSRSEGIPLVLMEAMARGKIVVAPNITGIPELVIDGKTGFLYESGSQESFLNRILFIHSLAIHSPMLFPECVQTVKEGQDYANPRPPAIQLDWIRHAARAQIFHNYNRANNLESFGDLFIERVARQTESLPHEDFVLQQI
jgi:glycosyltransferase involved in cell wall biosynthesis